MIPANWRWAAPLLIALLVAIAITSQPSSGAGPSAGTAAVGDWVRVEDPSPREDEARSIAVDSAGNVYVAGMDNATGSREWRVVKFDPAGAVLWRWIDDPSLADDEARAIALDGAGNAYVAGYDGKAGDREWRVVKLDPSGTEMWAWTDNPSPGRDDAKAVVVDPSGGIVVAGFDSGPGAARGRQWRAVKLSAAGTSVWSWTSDPSAGNDEAFAVAADAAGGLYVAGVDAVLGDREWRVVKLLPGGQPAWTWTRNPSGSADEAHAVAVAPSGAIFAAGFDNASGTRELRVSKLFPNGTKDWTWVEDTGLWNDELDAVAVDASGAIYAAGFDTVPGRRQWRLVKLLEPEVQAWTRAWDWSPGDDVVSALTFGPPGELYLAGTDAAPGSDEWRVVKFTLAGLVPVDLATQPRACGHVLFDGGAYNGTHRTLRGPGSYPIAAVPCPGAAFDAWSCAGVVCPPGVNGTVSIGGPATIVAQFRLTSPAPQVLATAPPSGATGVSNRTDIVIRFSTKMDELATQRAATASPAFPGIFGWLAGHETLDWNPAGPLASGTTYRVTVGTGAVSAAGGPLAAPYSFSFTVAASPGGAPQVVTTWPAEGQIGVPTNAPISITFSVQMDRAATEAAMSASPPFTGTFSWSTDGMGLTWTPSAFLAPNTSYATTIAASARSAAGVPLAAAYTFAFTTGAGNAPIPPRVVGVRPSDGASGVPLNARIWLSFSKPMDGPATERALAAMPPAAGAFQWDTAGLLLGLFPSAPLSPATRYTFTVGLGAKAADGAGVAAPYSFSFSTGNGSDTTPPLVSHSPVTSWKEGVPLPVAAGVVDDQGIVRVLLFHRREGAAWGPSLAMTQTVAGMYQGVIEAAETAAGTIEYYIEAEDMAGNVARSPAGGDAAPYRVTVTPNGGAGGGWPGGTVAGVPVLLLAIPLAVVGIVIAATVRRRGRSTGR